jgi:hypothetical protein
MLEIRSLATPTFGVCPLWNAGQKWGLGGGDRSNHQYQPTPITTLKPARPVDDLLERRGRFGWHHAPSCALQKVGVGAMILVPGP